MRTENSPRRTRTCMALAGVCVLGAQAAVAADLDSAFSASIGRSDNILRTDDNQVEENMATLGVELDLYHLGRKGTADVYVNADYIRYLDDSFDNEVVGGATVLADYEFVEDVFGWSLQYNYGQQVFDPLAPIRPDNRENVSYVTTGPNLEMDLSSRFVFKANAEYSLTSYEISPNENVRTGGRVSIGRLMNAGRTLSLVGTYEQVDYDINITTPDFDRQGVFLRFETFNSRGSLTIDLGVNELELEGSDQTSDGTLFRIDWVRDLASGIELALGAGSRYSDQGDIFRFFQNAAFDLRDTEDVAGIATPFRNNFATMVFSIDRPRTSLDLVALYSDEDYEGASTFDREVKQLNFSVMREFTRKFFGELGLNGSSREFFDLDRDDRDVQYTVALGYWMTPALSATLSFQHFDRSTNQGVTEFDEDRVFLRFSYVPKWTRE